MAAPLHYHHNEDEFSFVLSGRLGALLGDQVVIATPGTWVRKPRRQWHTFWNAADEPCEIIEIISPAGFENYFREVAASWGNVDRFAEINEKYSLEMRFDSVPGPLPALWRDVPLVVAGRTMQTVDTSPPQSSLGRAQSFAAWMLESFNRAAFCLMASVGHRLGLFDVMQQMPPATSHEIAGRAGLDERYVREWLAP